MKKLAELKSLGKEKEREFTALWERAEVLQNLAWDKVILSPRTRWFKKYCPHCGILLTKKRLSFWAGFKECWHYTCTGCDYEAGRVRTNSVDIPA